MGSIKKAKALLLEQKGLSGVTASSNYEASMPSEIFKVNSLREASSYVAAVHS